MWLCLARLLTCARWFDPIMPVPDTGTTNGTYITDRMFAYDCFFQLCNKAPRSGIYIQQAGVLQA